MSEHSIEKGGLTNQSKFILLCVINAARGNFLLIHIKSSSLRQFKPLK